jgi:hypothetical protein
MSKLNDAVSTENKQNIKAVISLTGEYFLKVADDILRHTENITHQKPASTKYLPVLGFLIVEGNATFLRKLLENPEVSSATISEDEDISKGAYS